MSTDDNFELAVASASDLRTYLARFDLPFGADTKVTRLTGGVSGAVVRVSDAEHEVVVKQAFAQLDVPGVWVANPERIVTEARCLSLFSQLVPGRAPRVLSVDPVQQIIVLEAAPPSWGAWKQILLEDPIEAAAVAIGKELGRVLAQWHAASSASDVLQQFENDVDFRALRSQPFYLDLASVHPALGAKLQELARDLHTQPQTVTLGDFSPKNILVGPSNNFWVLDLETAVAGRPEFDVAFMLMHLTLKALIPGKANALSVAQGFYAAYMEHQSNLKFAVTNLPDHVAALCLARVDGVSKVDYLTADTAQHVRQAAVKPLQRSGTSLDDFWQAITGLNEQR